MDYLRYQKDGKLLGIQRYYISSLDNNSELLAEAIRGYWGI